MTDADTPSKTQKFLPIELKDYMGGLAEQLVGELRPITAIKGITRNPDLLGAYAEAALRRLVRRYVRPMQVSTGAVIDHPIADPLRQVDLIVWAPFPAPAIFDVEGFGLIP